MTTPRVALADLIGATVKDAYEEGEVLHLALKGRQGLSVHVTVMRDPEGNGPGSLHIYDSNAGTFIGCLGGR